MGTKLSSKGWRSKMLTILCRPSWVEHLLTISRVLAGNGRSIYKRMETFEPVPNRSDHFMFGTATARPYRWQGWCELSGASNPRLRYGPTCTERVQTHRCHCRGAVP